MRYLKTGKSAVWGCSLTEHPTASKREREKARLRKELRAYTRKLEEQEPKVRRIKKDGTIIQIK